jgi:hypothetical protein
VKVNAPIRIVFAVVVLSCMVALLLMPGATTAVISHSHASGKRLVRVVSVVSLMALAATEYRGILHTPNTLFHTSRQVYAPGSGHDLIDVTCARLC